MSKTWDARTRAHQHIRIKRQLMTLGSYAGTFLVVLACSLTGLLAWRHLVIYLLSVTLLNIGFYLCFSRGWNLRMRDPNLTAEQMLLSVVPALYVMYYVEEPQARGSFLLMALVPLLYGVLGLNTRRFIAVGVINFLAYLGVLALLAWFRPGALNAKGDSIQVIALFGAMIQSALLGGYIYDLRRKLRRKNVDLNQALATISDMANRDELTGSCNRRYLMQNLEQEMLRCGRGATPFSLCLIDIDHFKRTNDTHGHLAGDQVLKSMAHEIEGSIRQIDCFGRYGGEEFLLILPQTALTGAQRKADRIRQAVSRLRFPDIGPDFRVTISVGVAEHRSSESLNQLMKRADDALYRAKGAGRNQVVCALPGDAA